MSDIYIYIYIYTHNSVGSLPSHLKVYVDSPICSLFPNEGERHILVPSSRFIDYNVFSLR